MIRIFFYAAIVLAAAWGFAWLADRPGELMILWQGQQIQMSLMVAASLLAILFLMILILWWLVRLVWTSPQTVSRYFRARKRDRGYQALSTGLIAAGAGNALLAAKMAERTRGLLSADQEPLIHLLDAQTALIKGDHEAARNIFEAMAEDPETRELGLRGLFMEARRLGADEAAEHYATKAAEKAPYLPWASQAVLEYRTRAGDYDAALRLLGQQKAAGITKASDTAREKAVLLTARAGSKLDGDPRGARDDALQALKLQPALVPAAIIAAKAYFRDNDLKRGAKLLEQVWKLDPHPEVADTYIRARSGDSTLDRLKRAEKLESLTPDNPVALAATAKAALDARLFDKAREKAEAALKRDPREGILRLLADIEEAETGDQARIRHYLAATFRAPRDPAWVADGVVSPTWQPFSPVTGTLGAFEWREPYARAEEEAFLDLDDVVLPPQEATDVLDLESTPVSSGQNATPEPAESAKVQEVAKPIEPEALRQEPVPAAEGGKTVVPFFGHAPDDPGVRPGTSAPAKKRKPLF